MRSASLLLVVLGASAAHAVCPDKVTRDISFVQLAVPEGTLRPRSADDFRFVDDTTTIDALQAKVGPPDGAKGSGTLVYCIDDQTIVLVETRKETEIRSVRVNNKLVYKKK